MERGRSGRKPLFVTLQIAALAVFVLIIAARPSGDLARAAELKTWTGEGADANWSTAANWSPAGAPVATDLLVFPSGAERQANNNDLAAGTSFTSIEVSGGSYVLGGNALQLTGALEHTQGNTVINLNIGGAGGIDLVDGTLRLNGANTFGGTVTLDDGRLIAGSSAALGTTGGSTILSGGILELIDGVTTAEPLVANDNTSEIMSNGTAVLTGTLDLQATLPIVVETGTLRMDGVISGPGGVIKAGAGTLTFTAANTYAGDTTIENSGVLALSGAGTLGSTVGKTTVEATGTLSLENAATLGGEDLTIAGAGVAGGGALRVMSTGAPGDSIALSANATVFVATGAELEMSTGLESPNPAFVLTKAGPGTLILDGNVGSDILLSAGTLLMETESTRDVRVTDGTLGGDGGFRNMTFEDGRLLPGAAGSGRLEATGDIVAEAGVTFSFRVEQASNGSLWADGAGADITLGGATLEVLGTADVTPGTTFVIVRQSTGTIAGTFAGLPDNAVFADAAGRFWRIEYDGTTPSTVSLVALADLEADLGVDLTGNTTVPQDTQNYVLNVALTNSADTAMSGVKVNVTLPNGVEFVSGPANCVGPDEDDVPQVVVCTVNSLPANGTTLALTLRVTAPSGGTLLFHAAIDWPGDDDNTANDQDTLSVAVTSPVEFPFKYYLPHVASDGPL